MLIHLLCRQFPDQPEEIFRRVGFIGKNIGAGLQSRIAQLVSAAHEDHPQAGASPAYNSQQLLGGHAGQLPVQQNQIRTTAAHVIEQRLRILRLSDNLPAWLLLQQEAQTKANPGLSVPNQDIQYRA